MHNDASSVLIDGPWEHRFVAANGARFHVAELGEGPLVVLLHGFPQFWWAWRHQLTALSEAGYRVAAIDLRATDDRDWLRGLVREAHIFVQGYRPGGLAAQLPHCAVPEPTAARRARGLGTRRRHPWHAP